MGMTPCQLVRSALAKKGNWRGSPPPPPDLPSLSIFLWRRGRGELYAFMTIFRYYEYNTLKFGTFVDFIGLDSTPFAADGPEAANSLFVVSVEVPWPR